jgi:hypothetical protein
MSSAGPTDDFWLTAHDGVKSMRVIGERPLGIGLAAGFLAELVHGKWCELRDGELFRTTADPPNDAALRALLAKMDDDERHWPPASTPVPPPSRTYVGTHLRPQHDLVWQPAPRETRPAGRGHQVREWMSYLANKKRAETLAGDRLVDRGLVLREERGLVFKTVRYTPRDTIVTANPASLIRGAAQRGYRLPWSEQFLAGLYLATGLHHYALATLEPDEHQTLLALLKDLDEPSRALLKAADIAVGDAAAVR